MTVVLIQVKIGSNISCHIFAHSHYYSLAHIVLPSKNKSGYTCYHVTMITLNLKETGLPAVVIHKASRLPHHTNKQIAKGATEQLKLHVAQLLLCTYHMLRA